MNLDVAGPFQKGNDIDGQAEFMLIGTYTWLKPQEEEKDEERAQEGQDAIEDQEEEDVGPRLEDEVDEEGDQEEEVGQDDDEEEGQEERARKGAQEEEEDQRPERPDEDVEERIDPQIEVIRVGIPLKGKSKDVVLEGLAELYPQLTADGFPVHTMHTDRDKEIINRKMQSWLASRGILHTTNRGQEGLRPMAEQRGQWGRSRRW